MKRLKFLSLGLAAALVCTSLPTQNIMTANAATDAEESTIDESQYTDIQIYNMDDFIAFVDNCSINSWSADKIITLNCDLDLTRVDFNMIPIFAGIFDGGNHTISFNNESDGYVAGLFRYIENGGVVRNIRLKGNITGTDEKECLGSICGVNHGTIKNCSFQGTVNGSDTIGGIVGINEATGIVTGCSVKGHITGYYTTGGIAGINHGTVTFCSNYSNINDDTEWVEEDDAMETGLLPSLTSDDDELTLYSGVDTGGITGYSDGLISRCSNYGRVGYEHTGYNIGGIAGRQTGMVSLCTNYGEIYGRKDVGGIVGQMEPYIEVNEAQSLRNAVNKLHDLIEKTLDDMGDGKDAISGDFDTLGTFGDNALDSGNELVAQMKNFADDNITQAQNISERIEHVFDLLPDVMNNISFAGDGFSRVNNYIKALKNDLEIYDRIDGSAFEETDYKRISLLTSVGGSLSCSSQNPEAGELVTITAAPDDGYKLDKISATDADGNDVVIMPGDSENEFVFTMTTANVKVEGQFAHTKAFVNDTSSKGPEKHGDYIEATIKGKGDLKVAAIKKDVSIEALEITGITVEVDPGDTVIIYPIAENGYYLTDIEVTSSGSGIELTPPERDGEAYSFRMPSGTVEITATFEVIPLILTSNMSGSASYSAATDGTIMLKVNPDSGYTLADTPIVTTSKGTALNVSKSQGSAYTYEFNLKGFAEPTTPATANISFTKQNKRAAADGAMDDIDAAINAFHEAATQASQSVVALQSLLASSPSDADAIKNELLNLADAVSGMTDAASTILSSLSTISTIISPYVGDAVDDVKGDIDKAIDEVQNMINSLKAAASGVRGIVDYINMQPDLAFSTLGEAFDAHRENLHNQLEAISDVLKALNNDASNYSDKVNNDLKAVNDQLNVVFNILSDRLTDYTETDVSDLYEEISDEDIEKTTTGRVDSCKNTSIIKGDINIGGIAGAMSIDEEDPEDNAAGSVDFKLGQRYITKCIINNSINEGYITSKKDGAGGIVGYMRHGIVVDSEGYGSVESTEGDYVGGIAGESFTVIKRCYALCTISGAKNVGGIAGYADTLQNCYSIVNAEATIGKKGAIAGQITSYDITQSDEDSDAKVCDNYYVSDELYGIDNVSYIGVAEPISYEDLLTTEGLPNEFWHLKVTYRIEDAYLGTQELKFGESLAHLNYPDIPQKDGFYGVWPDYSDKVMTGNLFIEGEYKDNVLVVESSEKTEDTTDSGYQKPYALVEKVFTTDTVLNAELIDMAPPEAAVGQNYVIYDISLENSGVKDDESFAVRLLNPYEDAQVWAHRDGNWTQLESKARGQYLQVDMIGSSDIFCIIEIKSLTLIVTICIVAAILIIIILTLIIKGFKKRIKKLKAKKQQNADTAGDTNDETSDGSTDNTVDDTANNKADDTTNETTDKTDE